MHNAVCMRSRVVELTNREYAVRVSSGDVQRAKKLRGLLPVLKLKETVLGAVVD